MIDWFTAAIYDRLMQKTEAACLGAWRAELVGSIEGRGVELGAGTGANIQHYGPNVESVRYFEPDPYMAKRLRAKLERHPRRAERDAVVESLDSIVDASQDFAVVTLVLCTVPDPFATLAEVRRMLVPGGRLLFLEHVAAHDRPERLAWQRRLEPVWKRVAGGCHLTRETARTIEDAGFAFERLERASMRKAAPWVRPTVRGIAVRT